MFHGTTRRAALLGASAVALAASGVDAQTKRKLRFSAAFTEQDLRAEAYKNFAAAIKDDFDFEPYLGQHPVQAGHRARRASARQPRNVQSRAGRYLEADPGLVADDLGVPVPGLRPPEEDVQERRRPGIRQDGQGPARHPGHHAGLFRLAPRQSRGRTSRSRRRPTLRGIKLRMPPRRVLAVPRRVDRREPDPRRLCRGLHRAADRHHRRPGQSARREPADEVLRGDLAVRPDRPRRSATTSW